jgi:uncharacterized membrane protein
MSRKIVTLILCIGLFALSTAFTPCRKARSQIFIAPRETTALFVSEGDDAPSTTIWLPQLRRVMGSVATLGALETAYLTYNKVVGEASSLCGENGNCDSVLLGPYSNVPLTDIPLAAVGFLAYAAVTALALLPIFSEDKDDTQNRVLLTTLTTTMGTFSVFLMILLFGVLQTSCPFCVLSAACSTMLASLAWIGGCLPKNSKEGAKATGTSFLATTVAALVLLASVDDSSAHGLMATMAGSSDTSTLVAADSNAETQLFSAPQITTQSSDRALTLSTKLQALNAKMYGAYWCSHCYDQKQTLGKQAFSKIQYFECSKDGVDSQSKLCKARDVPGYPTWEINGKLYPGEQELEELEELVQKIQSELK